MNLEDIKKNPYEVICDYVESLYPHTGRKVFEVLSLLPVSLILPDLPYQGKKIRSNMNAMFLAPSGAGKTSLAKLFAKLSYSPIELESATSVGLEQVLTINPSFFTLIVGDFARMSKDAILMKTLEGILGEEKQIKRKTARKELDLETEGVALLCGVSTDLHSYMMTGMIFRVVPILLSHSADEHSEIGATIASRIGISSEDNMEELIKEFYNNFLVIQTGQSKEVEKVTGYKIDPIFSKGLYEEWDYLTKKQTDSSGIQFLRELQEGFRFLISHAFLNVYNRKVEKGILYPTQEDFEVAKRLMKQTIVFKLRLISSQTWMKQLNNAKDFKRLMDSDRVNKEVKNMMHNLVKATKPSLLKK